MKDKRIIDKLLENHKVCFLEKSFLELVQSCNDLREYLGIDEAWKLSSTMINDLALKRGNHD